MKSGFSSLLQRSEAAVIITRCLHYLTTLQFTDILIQILCFFNSRFLGTIIMSTRFMRVSDNYFIRLIFYDLLSCQVTVFLSSQKGYLISCRYIYHIATVSTLYTCICPIFHESVEIRLENKWQHLGVFRI